MRRVRQSSSGSGLMEGGLMGVSETPHAEADNYHVVLAPRHAYIVYIHNTHMRDGKLLERRNHLLVCRRWHP